MNIEKIYLSDAIVLKINESRLGADIAAQFKAALMAEVEAGHLRMILDLSALTFMDSSGLGALVAILKAIGKRGDLLVAGAQDTVQSLFKLTRMDKVFRSYPTVEEAVGALTPQLQTRA